VGKDKLAVLLREQGRRVSTSMVAGSSAASRIGVCSEPVSNHISARKGRPERPYAIRKPKDYAVKEPGDWSNWTPWTSGLCLESS